MAYPAPDLHRKFLTALALGLLWAAGCTVERDFYVFDLPVAVVDADPLDLETYTVVLSWQTCDGSTDGDCDRYLRIIDEEFVVGPGEATLTAEFEANECSCLVDFHLGVWRDDDNDGRFAGQWDEPCAAMILEDPYQRDEPIPLTVSLGGCQALDIAGQQVPVTCCQTP